MFTDMRGLMLTAIADRPRISPCEPLKFWIRAVYNGASVKYTAAGRLSDAPRPPSPVGSNGATHDIGSSVFMLLLRCCITLFHFATGRSPL